MTKVSELVSSQIGNAITNVKTWGGIMYNVAESNILPDGTDQTSKLQTLINTAVAAGRKAIFFPHGTYTVTALTSDNQVVFFGDNSSFTGGYTGTINQLGTGGSSATNLYINIKNAPYNAKGDGTTNDAAAIQSAITALSSGGIIAFPPGTYLVGTNFTVPSNVTLLFTNGAMLSISSGITVTINGGIEADMFQIFSGSGSVAGSPKIPYSLPHWFGAKGDYSQDDAPAINEALAFTDSVYLPTVSATGTKYKCSTITLGTYKRIFSDPSAICQIVPTDTTLFSIQGNDVVLENLYIDASATTTESHPVFLFNTNVSGLDTIRIKNVQVINAYAVIRDSNNATNKVVNAWIEDMKITLPKGTPIKVYNFFAFIHFQKVIVDMTQNSTAPTFNAYHFEGGQGIYLERCDALGIGTGGTGNSASNGFYFNNVQALWLDRLDADTVGGYGYSFNSVTYLEANNLIASLCGAGSYYINSCSYADFSDLYAGGRSGQTWAPASANGVWIVSSPATQVTQIRSQNHTGDGVRVDNSNSCLINGAVINGNGAVGLHETGTSQYNLFTNILSFSNTTSSANIVGTSSNVTNWKPSSGTYIANTVGPATV